MESLKINSFQQDLLDLLIQDARLSEILHAGYLVLNNPLMLFNHRGEVLLKSEYENYHDPDWEETGFSCFFARKKFSHITAHDFTEANPFLIHKKNSPYKRMATVLPVPSSNYYLITIESQRPFTDTDRQLLLDLANALAIKLRRRKKSSTLWINTHELFISNLLQGEIANEDIARDYAGNFSIIPKDVITLITVRAIKNLDESDMLKLSHPLTEIFPKSKISIYKGDLIILVFDPKSSTPFSKSMKKARTFLKNNNLRACVGIPVSKLTDLKGQYHNTASLLRISTKLEIQDLIIYYEHYVIQNMLFDLDTNELKFLCHPGILELFESDKTEGTQFIVTIYAYILMYCNRPDAARMLNINSNTLKYRLKNIDHYLGPNWEKISTTLYLSIKILHILYPSDMKDCERLFQHFETIRR
jgi:sugar diacid utilization regulator